MTLQGFLAPRETDQSHTGVECLLYPDISNVGDSEIPAFNINSCHQLTFHHV